MQEGLLSVTSKSMLTKYFLTAWLSLPRKRCGYYMIGERPNMTKAVVLDVKHQTKPKILLMLLLQIHDAHDTYILSIIIYQIKKKRYSTYNP